MVCLDCFNWYNWKNNILGLKMNVSKIITEELVELVLESITKNFTRAIETYKKIQLNQQDLRKAFVNEKDPKKKEKLKQALIKMHSQVVKAEKEFNKALQTEPVEDDLTEKKNKGLWANIHAKRKRGEKPAHKNSKAHKSAVKAAKAINKEGKLNEAPGYGNQGTIGTKIPGFKSPLEAYKWIMSKRNEAMDIEQEMMDTNAEIQQLYGEMEQEAEAGGGPIADRYGREIEDLEDQHKDLRAQLDMLMAEIDEYDQN